MWSGAARSTPINDKTDRKKPSAWRKGTRKTRRSVNAVSTAQSENVFGAPGRPAGDGRHASVASAESHSVTSPRWTKACSYADQCPTRYFVLYFGWTFDLMSRSCTRSGHRGQRAYSCLVAAEGLCTNAPASRHRLRRTRHLETRAEPMTGVLGDRELGAAAPSVTLSGQRGTPEGANRSTGRHPVADDVAPGRKEPPVSNHDLHWIANHIWGIADDVLRDLYVRGKYRDVILPMTVLRRLDAVLVESKPNVLEMKAVLDQTGVVEQDAALRQAAGQAFYNTSKFTLRDLRARASRQQLRADFEAYLDGFSPNVQDILENFEFRNQIPRLSKADALGTLIEKLTSPDVNLSPAPVKHADGSVRSPGLDNHGMGSIFEELVRRFNEENNEEAGEHWTPRDAVRLMAKLVFLPVAEEIKSGTYLLYDGACGTGGMLTVAEETLGQLAAERGKDVSTHLFGQEINAETYAICTADLLLKGDGEAADNIVGGPEHSTLANDAFPSREFDRGGPRFSDRLLRWSPDPTGGIWNATQETELPG